MHTAADVCVTETAASLALGEKTPRTHITTTLYHLIAAVQTAVEPHDDALVVATVWHLLHGGRATWHRHNVTCRA
jgi:hypothetical protein